LTYKKAIRLAIETMRAHGFDISRTAQKQVGYLALYATEGEISKDMHHDLKAILQHLPCKFEPGSMADDVFLAQLDRYAKLLERENDEGGEISLGWLIKEANGKELWQVFAGQEV
jgi:hypothetical protein